MAMIATGRMTDRRKFVSPARSVVAVIASATAVHPAKSAWVTKLLHNKATGDAQIRTWRVKRGVNIGVWPLTSNKTLHGRPAANKGSGVLLSDQAMSQVTCTHARCPHRPRPAGMAACTRVARALGCRAVRSKKDEGPGQAA